MKIKPQIASYFFNVLLIALLPIGYDIHKDRVEAKENEKQLVIETAKQRTVHYNETITLYVNELGQTIREKETVERTITILEDKQQALQISNSKLKSEAVSLESSLEKAARGKDQIEKLNIVKPVLKTTTKKAVIEKPVKTYIETKDKKVKRSFFKRLLRR